MKILACIFAFLLPPLGVLLGNGSAVDFLLNVLLTLLGWLPGVLHAFYVILTRSK